MSEYRSLPEYVAMQTESPGVKTLSLGSLVAAEMLILGLSLWLCLALRPDAHVPLLYQSTVKLAFAFFLITLLPGVRRHHFSRSWACSQVRDIAVALVVSACVLGVMMLLIPFTGLKTLFPAAILAALTGLVVAAYSRSISGERK